MGEITHTHIEQDQPKYIGNEPYDAKFPDLVEQKTAIPLEEGVVEKAQDFEERRISELNAEREEHKRRTAGGGLSE